MWVAEHRTLRTQVVVKFLRSRPAGAGEGLKDSLLRLDGLLRFVRDVAAYANVKSPHVAQVVDHGLSDDGVPFIVTELLDGNDLGARVEAGGPMPLADVEQVISQTCKALARAEERGIAHGDITPTNIFFANVGGNEIFVKLLDLGIAKASASRDGVGHVTKSAAPRGTPFYMSPEQVVGGETDQRADVWALGVVAFEALTGTKPFHGETTSSLALAICSSPMPVPSTFNPSLSAAVDRWFAQACARELTARFHTARELAEALHQALVTPVPGLMPVVAPTPREPSVPDAIEAPPPPAMAAPEPGPAHAATVDVLGTTAQGIGAKLDEPAAAPLGRTQRLAVLTADAAAPSPPEGDPEPAAGPSPEEPLVDPLLSTFLAAPAEPVSVPPSEATYDELPAKPRGKGGIVAIAAVALAVAAGVGFKVTRPSPAAPPAPPATSVAAVAESAPVPPLPPPAVSVSPAASTAPSASAAQPVPVATPSASSVPSASSAPVAAVAPAPSATATSRHSRTSGSRTKTEPVKKSTDRDKIE